MSPKQKRRLAFAAALIAAGGLGAWAIVGALKDNVLYFRSPSDVAAHVIPEGTAFRLGGLVEKGSVTHGPGAEVHFSVTDGKGHVPVAYNGVLPALFREGQGVVTLGALDGSGTLQASEVLAKHDEKYMPPEVVESLKRAGRWKEGEQ